MNNKKLMMVIGRELGVKSYDVWQDKDGNRYRMDAFSLNKEVAPDIWVEADAKDYKRLLKNDLRPVWLPNQGETYYVPRPDLEELCSKEIWNVSKSNKNHLGKEMVYKTSDEAIYVANEMLKYMDR